MVKFTHLLVLSILAVWLAGVGCIGNDPSKQEESETNTNFSEAGNGAPSDNLDPGLTQAEITELNSDMENLDNLLENASLDEEIDINVEMEKE